MITDLVVAIDIYFKARNEERHSELQRSLSKELK